MKAAIYARVSTDDQNCAMQIRELRELAARYGWETVVEYVEMQSTRKRRPKLEELLADAKARKFDVVLCWKLDRLARNPVAPEFCKSLGNACPTKLRIV